MRLVLSALAAASGTLALAQTASDAPAFSAFALERFRQGRFAYLRPVYPSPAKDESVPAALSALYGKHLPEGKSASAWTARALPETLRLPQGRPVAPLWNTHLVWALDAQGRRVRGFRPVDTTTECSSGCTPVVFHLSFDPKGAELELIEDPQQPLRKIHHEAFSAEDRARVAKILAKIPAAYESIPGPRELTDADAAWPPRTWTFFEPTLVKGGAYTSFRIYQAGLPLKRYLAGGDASSEREEEARAELISASLGVMSAADAWKRLAVLGKLAGDARAAPSLRQTAQAFVPELLLWLVQFHAARPKQVAKELRAPWLARERARLACAFYRDLLRSPQGARLLRGLLTDKHVPVCPSPWVADLPGLAAVAAGLPAPKGWDPSRLHDGLLNDAGIARLQLQALSETGRQEAFLSALADYRVRFPKSAVHPDTTSAQLGPRAKAAETKYRERLAARFLSQPEKLPEVQVSDAKGRARRFDPKGKQVLVFFGSWCEHCQELLRAWATQYPKELWPKTQLIESLSPQPSLTAASELCRAAPLPKPACDGLLQLPAPAEAPAFHDALGLHAVPRILLLDAQGRIRAYDFRYDDALEGSDPARDLAWLVQEINR